MSRVRRLVACLAVVLTLVTGLTLAGASVAELIEALNGFGGTCYGNCARYGLGNSVASFVLATVLAGHVAVFGWRAGRAIWRGRGSRAQWAIVLGLSAMAPSLFAPPALEALVGIALAWIVAYWISRAGLRLHAWFGPRRRPDAVMPLDDRSWTIYDGASPSVEAAPSAPGWAAASAEETFVRLDDPETDVAGDGRRRDGGLRAIPFRVVSAAGAWAYWLSYDKSSRSAHRISWMTLFVVPFLVVLAATGIRWASLGSGETVPTQTTVDAIWSDQVVGAHHWVTFTGTVQWPHLHYVPSRGGASDVYLVTDANGTKGVLVRTDPPLGQSVRQIEVTGIVVPRDGGIFSLADSGTIIPWSKWARETFPAIDSDSSLFVDDGRQPGDGYGALVLVLVALAAWLTIGFALGLRSSYIVFRASNDKPLLSALGEIPPRLAGSAHVTGPIPRERHQLLRGRTVRESAGSIRVFDGRQIDIQTGASPSIRLAAGRLTGVRAGIVYPLRGPRAAIRLEFGSDSWSTTRHDNLAWVVLSFPSFLVRDRWLRVFEAMVVRPNTLR